MAKRWKPTEISYLKRYAKGRTVEELRKRFRTNRDEVEGKLKELGLSAKDSVGRARLANDPQVKLLERGIRLVHAEKWREAAKIFARIIKETDVRSVAQQARTYAAVCAEKSAAAKKVDDPFLEAVYERNQENLDVALDICKRGGRCSKDERFAYLAAALHALRDEFDEAARFFELAVELNPANRIHAHHDTDFAALRSHPEYSELFRIP
jgi:tetratricopeptide (TPR) repeat protein